MSDYRQQEEQEQQQMTVKLAAALVAAQGEMENPTFDAANPHFRSKYASLVAVRESVMPVLKKHGLCIIQFPITAQRGEQLFAGCTNVVIHESGESMRSECLLPLDKANAHGAGSCITYARRYSLMAIAGVVGDDDDDGNSAVDSDKGKITPTAGAKDLVKPARQKIVEGVASSLIDMFEAEIDIAEQHKCMEEAGLSNEERIYLWSFLGSKQRAAIKKHHDSLKAK